VILNELAPACVNWAQYCCDGGDGQRQLSAPDRDFATRRNIVLVVISLARQAKVRNFAVIVGVDQHVPGCKVAVNKAFVGEVPLSANRTATNAMVRRGELKRPQLLPRTTRNDKAIAMG